MKSLIGRLLEVQQLTDKDECTEGLWFRPETGEAFPVAKARANTPRNTLIEAYFDAGALVHFNVLMQERRDQSDKSVALIWVLEPGQTETPRDREIIERAAADMQAELRRQAKGKWVVKVTPYVLEGYEGRRHVTFADWAEIKDRTSRDHTYWHCWGGYLRGLKGHAQRDAPFAWTFANASYPTLMHEQGHCLGLGHATAGLHNQYGGTGWMAHPAAGDSFNGAQQSFLGIVDDEAIYKLDPNSSAIVHLIDPDSEPRARYPGLFCGVEIAKSYGERYIVAPYQGKLMMWQSDGHSWGTTIEGFDPPFHVETVERQDGVWKVDVRWNKDGPPPVDKDWPVLPIPDRIQRPQSGLYHEPRLHGQGLDLWMLDNRAVAYWYTHDQDGKPCWYECACVSFGDLLWFDILDPRLAEMYDHPVGAMCVWYANGRLNAWYSFNDGASGLIDAELLGRRQGGKLYQFTDGERSGLSLLNENTGFIYETGSMLTSMGIERWTNWYLADWDTLYEVQGGRHRVESDAKVTDAGSVWWTRNQCGYGGQVRPMAALT